MELLVFDTENRTAALRLTRQELLDMDAELLGSKSGRVLRSVRTMAGSIEVYLDVFEDPR